MTTLQDAIDVVHALLAPWEDAEGAPVLRDREREKAKNWLRRAEEAATAPDYEMLRAEQSAAVMPLIGPLLDAWCEVPLDLRSYIQDESPELARLLDEIDEAIEDDDPNLDLRRAFEAGEGSV